MVSWGAVKVQSDVSQISFSVAHEIVGENGAGGQGSFRGRRRAAGLGKCGCRRSAGAMPAVDFFERRL
jgi:hypothetical protein